MTTVRWSPSARRTEPKRASRSPVAGQPGGAEQARHLVEDPELLGDRAGVGVGVHQGRGQPAPGQDRRQPGRDQGPARRTGRAPHGDHPSRRRTPGDLDVERVVGGDDDLLVVGLEQVEDPRQLLVAGQGVDTDAGGAGTGRVRAPAAGDGDHAHLVPVEQVDRALVEARSVERHQRGIGLAGAAGREQVVDVDAALEDHQPGTTGDQLQHRRLPRGAGGDDEDDDHRQPRPTTVSDGSSVVASSRKNRWASGSRTPRTSIRPPSEPNAWSGGGASSTVTPARTGRPLQTGVPVHPLRVDGRR